MNVDRFKIGFRWRLYISQFPKIYAAWMGLRYPPAFVFGINQMTELVIEGYPRSGNTFALYALLDSQTCPVNVLHHSHNPSRIIEAVKADIPTLVLIRNPIDSIISFCIFEPKLSIRLALSHWIRFYKAIKPYSGGYLLATFEEVIEDYGKVIDKLNDKYTTSFSRFEHTEENVERIFCIIEQKIKKINQRGNFETAVELKISVPSEKRASLKNDLREELINNQKYKSALLYAQDLYNTMVNTSTIQSKDKGSFIE